MGLDHLLEHGTKSTPQTEPLPGREVEQVANDAGGYVWKAGDAELLRRFLILGTEGGSYYVGEHELTRENVKRVRDLVSSTDGQAAVAEIVRVSQAGRAPNNDYALFALALAIAHGDRPTRRAAAEALPLVARTGTHLLHFAAYAESQRGWGKTLKWAVSNWFLAQELDALAYQAVKYRSRDGWSLRDLLRLSHPKSEEHRRSLMLRWIVDANKDTRTVAEVGIAATNATVLPTIVTGFELAQLADTPKRTAELVREYGLPREALRSEHLTDPDVWRAMIWRGMPMTALMRNLANMTRLGVLEGEWRDAVVQQLADAVRIRKARVHPFAVLTALRTYASGRGFRGSNTWQPIPQVLDALDAAFYLAFDNVETTGKRILLGVDVSGSMGHAVNGGGGPLPLAAREAAAAMALVTLHAEPNVEVVGFTNRMHTVAFSRRQRLDDALARMPSTGEGTDCAVPLAWAAQAGRDFDAVVLYTDNQTWAGPRHVPQVLREYRDRFGETRMVACGMVANEFTVLDPNDRGSLNVAGFDAAAPAIVSGFVAGEV